MKELNLHGVRHEDVKQKVIKFIEQNWDGDENGPEIVTGHSQDMRQLVIDVLGEYKLDYRVGDFLGVNTGFIRVEPF